MKSVSQPNWSSEIYIAFLFFSHKNIYIFLTDLSYLTLPLKQAFEVGKIQVMESSQYLNVCITMKLKWNLLERLYNYKYWCAHRHTHTKVGCIKLTVTFWHHLSTDMKRSRHTGNNYCWLPHFEPTLTYTHPPSQRHLQGRTNRSQSEQMRLLSWCHLHNDKITILNELSPQNW